MRLLTGVLLLMASALGFAQDALKIEFSSEGPREVWIHPTSTPGRSREPLAVTGTSVELPLTGASLDKDAVSVRDVQTGRVAMKPLRGLKSPLKLVTSDYTRLYQLDVDLQHEAKPVATAVVLLESGAEKRREILDASGKGIVSFYNLSPGPYRIFAEVKSDNQTVATPAQTFNPKPEDGAAPKLAISVNEKVEVVGASPAKPTDEEEGTSDGEEKTSKEGEKEGKADPGMGIVGTIIGMILGLALLAGIGYGIYRYLQVRGADTEAQLAKLGLGGNAATPDPGPAAAPSAAPLQKIVLADSDPTPLGMGAPAAAPLSVGGVATPRLVRDNGDVVLLADGANEIGREAAIPLPGETSVSRRHASIERQGSSIIVSDLGSTNGTWVNGRRIDGPTPLQPGDQVMFGAIKFRYEV